MAGALRSRLFQNINDPERQTVENQNITEIGNERAAGLDKGLDLCRAIRLDRFMAELVVDTFIARWDHLSLPTNYSTAMEWKIALFPLTGIGQGGVDEWNPVAPQRRSWLVSGTLVGLTILVGIKTSPGGLQGYYGRPCTRI